MINFLCSYLLLNAVKTSKRVILLVLSCNSSFCHDWLIILVGYTTQDEDYLKFLFEGSPDFCVLPSFSVIPAFGASTGMFMGGVPGLKVDPTKVCCSFRPIHLLCGCIPGH